MRKTATLLLVITLLLGSCAKSPEPDVFLKIGSDFYNLDDFFKTNIKNNFIKLPEETKVSKINSFVENKLYSIDAEKQNYEQTDSALSVKLKGFKKNVLIQTYLNKTILDSVITDEYIKQIYDKTSVEVKASHILIKPENKMSSEEALAKANDIYKKILNGENFTDLANEYSADKAAPGGDLGYFSWGKMVPAFQEKVFSMEIGEISKPLKTQFGYHIIKLVDKRTKPKQQTFEKSKKSLKKNAIQSHRQELNKRYLETVERIKKSMDYKLNNEVLPLICDEYKDKKYKGGYLQIMKQIEANPVIITTKNENFDKEWFTNKIEEYNYDFNAGKYLSDPKGLSQVLEYIFTRNIFYTNAQKMNLQDDPDFLEEYNIFKNKEIINHYKKENIKKLSKVSEKELKDYYEKNKSEYMTDEKFEVREIFVKDESLANEILTKIQMGEMFEKLSDEYTERYNKKKVKGYLGFISNKQYGKIGKIAEKLKKDEVCKTPIKHKDGFSIIKVYDKKDAELKDFDKVKHTINRKLQSKKEKEVKEKLYKKLLNKYKVKIYWKTFNIKNQDS